MCRGQRRPYWHTGLKKPDFSPLPVIFATMRSRGKGLSKLVIIYSASNLSGEKVEITPELAELCKGNNEIAKQCPDDAESTAELVAKNWGHLDMRWSSKDIIVLHTFLIVI